MQARLTVLFVLFVSKLKILLSKLPVSLFTSESFHQAAACLASFQVYDFPKGRLRSQAEVLITDAI